MGGCGGVGVRGSVGGAGAAWRQELGEKQSNWKVTEAEEAGEAAGVSYEWMGRGA